jgi:hypothetical protein
MRRDAVLELGSVPLAIVTARIDCFIAEDGKGPCPGYGVSRSRVVRVEGRGAKTKEECCARYQVRETGSLILAFCFSCDFCYVRAPAIL